MSNEIEREKGMSNGVRERRGKEKVLELGLEMCGGVMKKTTRSKE